MKQSLVSDFILQNKPDSFLLQETFVDNSFLANSIEQNKGLDMRCIWKFGKGNSCGVALFLLNKYECLYSKFFIVTFLAELCA